MGRDVWILGGTGRSGRATATALIERGITPVLVGRDAERLAHAADQVKRATSRGSALDHGTAADHHPSIQPATGCKVLTAPSPQAVATEIQRHRPAVVINTIGPFTTTAPVIARACITAGTDYVDLANDLAAVSAILDLDKAATDAGRTLVTGAGFGVTATESVVVALCAGRVGALDVRVDMVPALEVEAGPIGDALAATLLEGLPGVAGGGRFEGRRYRDGRLVRARIAGEVTHLTLPDGVTVTTASMPLGELMAAQRASQASSVVSSSSEVPGSALVRAIMPLATSVLRWSAVREFAKRRLAKVEVKARAKPREHSWGHARVTWADGTTREGWLRVGEAQQFTGTVPAEVTRRLLEGEGGPGAHTPAALFGAGLAAACGGEYLLD
ncbi:saccharopine dehydrogenase NADP-binding domain-containing protein [Actinoplanes sp. TFC3]|uniref:saccharopine dehydrogenase NADP-binding domain-containing protein n=1 Tax=Actinoplanes sp. TFC3 TaxID=1710355 RepID=UPI0009E77681|nr:saccharopine dehydrogenase NADP-binding domain-containing protein [Actinoplanes sp. TFC3]